MSLKMAELRFRVLILFALTQISKGKADFPQSQLDPPHPKHFDDSAEFVIRPDSLGTIPKYKRFSTSPKKIECTAEFTEKQNNCVQGLRSNYEGPDIPTTRNETETLCRSFNGVMKCFEEWSKVCEDDKLMALVLEKAYYIVDMYNPICKDSKSQFEHYIHGECYSKTNPAVANCASSLEQKINMLNNQCRTRQTICCLKGTFLRCVSAAVSYYNCSERSSKAALEIAKRFAGLHPEQLRRRNTTDVCARFMDENNCKRTLRSMDKSCYKKLANNAAYKAPGHIVSKKIILLVALAATTYSKDI